MLRRLELVGFKSFADKTIFDFGDGITGIVGPNGSGKSNIVDAVRWILGEQSAKSLRGGEMADVIFNGSSSRRSLGLAEVTMIFDNARRSLATDSEEVQITRRVYRDGEGEYLINGQICRLKDIKDLFLGSGAGNDAYCIIAQGRVDALLQASTRDRRTIFEEAAGISRFKARKIETLRKLERVDQNVARLRDIIDEVDKQLRTVKLAASKAQRFQEYSARLKLCRVAVALHEFGQLRARLAGESAQLDALRGELDQRAARAGACEAEAERLEIFLADLDDRLREQEGRLAQVLQQVGREQSTIAHESALAADLETEQAATRRRLAELTLRLAELTAAAGKADLELQDADVQAQAKRQQVRALDAELKATVERQAQLNEQTAGDKVAHLEEMRRAAHWQNEAIAAKAHADNLRRERERLRLRTDQAATALASMDLELQELADADASLQQRCTDARGRMQAARDELALLLELRDRAAERLSGLRQRRSGLASRIEVLESLIQSHEGLGSGVREVVEQLEHSDGWGSVLGMIADFLTVKREVAPLIDLALGDWAQHFVVRDVAQLVAALAQRETPFSGRVSFIPLQALPEPAEDEILQRLRGNRVVRLSSLSRLRHGEPPSTLEHPGLVALADQLVTSDHPELADLPGQLLGRTLLVRDLAIARAIAAHASGFRLITLQGELLEPDGTFTVGTHQAETGLLSRKSELRELRDHQRQVEAEIAATEQDLLDLKIRLSDGEASAERTRQEMQVLSEQAADLRARVERHRERRQGVQEEVAVSTDEIARIDQDFLAAEQALVHLQAQAQAAEAQVQILLARAQQADVELRQLEGQRQQQQIACTHAQVELAKFEERLRALRGQHQQLHADAAQRLQERADCAAELAGVAQRLADSQRAALAASAVVALAALEKESLQRQVADQVALREQKRADRARLAQNAQAVRADWRKHQEKIHQRDLEVTNLRHQKDTLAQRLAEEYQLDLAALHEEFAAPAGEPTAAEISDPAESAEAQVLALPLDRGALRAMLANLDAPQVQEEIEELRRKLHRLGNVNLDSLVELSELETRARTQHEQFEDLCSAKKSLEEIIQKINQDSRRLFAEAFETIRTHFQELFRKLFGGGMADVLLEDEADMLESGIEINARPPGKELRSISLLSGGEKTMTAVALLLAIFRSKPSPFCLLDEVDAALDEANIDRFTSVLREFTDLSQFIIVTHSKKTMAAADVIYGITMQESGISKKVAVRFEDWVEDTPSEAEVA